jgi:cytochrome c biogenesis factor
MIGELGHFALWLALAISLVQAIGGLLGGRKRCSWALGDRTAGASAASGRWRVGDNARLRLPLPAPCPSS